MPVLPRQNVRMESVESRSKGLTVYLLEGDPVDDDPEVVEKGKGDHHRPVITETSRGIEDEGPIRGTRTKTLCSCLSRVASITALLLLLLRRIPTMEN